MKPNSKLPPKIEAFLLYLLINISGTLASRGLAVDEPYKFYNYRNLDNAYSNFVLVKYGKLNSRHFLVRNR